MLTSDKHYKRIHLEKKDTIFKIKKYIKGLKRKQKKKKERKVKKE